MKKSNQSVITEGPGFGLIIKCNKARSFCFCAEINGFDPGSREKDNQKLWFDEIIPVTFSLLW